MTTTAVGKQAEQAAAEFLVRQGFTIVAQNWRTRWCEIDIIAQRSDAIYFVEVKYRGSSRQGTGLEYVTRAKLHQMAYASEHWQARHAWNGDVCLSAIEVAAPNYTVAEFIEAIV